MADIVLYDERGDPQTYEGVETVSFDTPDGGKARFSEGVVPGESRSPFAVYEGDTLDQLYFNSDFTLDNDFTESTQLSLIEAADQDGQNAFLLYVKYIYNELDPEARIMAKITQGGEVVKTVQLYTNFFFGWSTTHLDLSGYTLPPVSFVLSDVVANIVSNTPMSFGATNKRPEYLLQDGEPVQTLCFNTAIDLVLGEGAMDQALASLEYVEVEEGGMAFRSSPIGFGGNLISVDLSSFGLGDGYVMLWNPTLEPIYSTATFDASAIIPGFKVEQTGWQTSIITCEDGIPVNFGEFPPLFRLFLDYIVAGFPVLFGAPPSAMQELLEKFGQ